VLAGDSGQKLQSSPGGHWATVALPSRARRSLTRACSRRAEWDSGSARALPAGADSTTWVCAGAGMMPAADAQVVRRS
jgi:hypothetical protein